MAYRYFNSRDAPMHTLFFVLKSTQNSKNLMNERKTKQ